jgi:hypothetical protein
MRMFQAFCSVLVFGYVGLATMAGTLPRMDGPRTAGLQIMIDDATATFGPTAAGAGLIGLGLVLAACCLIFPGKGRLF